MCAYGAYPPLVNIQQNWHMSIFFKEQFSLGHGNEFGKVGLLESASFFLWLVAHDRCWTADRLARRGLPHPERIM